MKLFDKRPLSLILCIMLSGFVVFSFSDVMIRWALVLISAIIFASSFVLKEKQRVIITVSVALFISLIASYLYFDNHFKAYEIYKDQITVSGAINTMDKGRHKTSVTIDAYTLDGDVYYGYKLISYLENDVSLGLRPGDKVEFECTLSDFSYDSDFDISSYYISRGIGSIANIIGTIRITEHSSPDNEPLREVFKNARSDIAHRAVMLSDPCSGGLLTALLLGDKSLLPKDMDLNFKIIGINHILALSGMNLALLSFALDKCLSAIGLKRKLRIAVTLGFIVLYIALTGFPISVVRAGVMLAVTYVLFLLSRTHDSVTSLTTAVFLIILFTPYAIYDISLWLSAFATLGVIMLGDYSARLTPPKHTVTKLFRPLLIAFLASVFAIGATLALTVFTFDTISILSPASTIIFSPVLELIMYVGCIMLLVGDIIPLGWLMKPLGALTEISVSYLAGLDGMYLSSDSILMHILVLSFTVLFFLFLILNVKHKKISVFILSLFVVIITLTASVQNIIHIADDDIVYSSGTRDSKILIKSNSEIALISSAAFSEDSGYSALSLIHSQKLLSIDKYYFTHYSYGVVREISAVKLKAPIKKVCVPYPVNESEEEIARSLIKELEGTATEIEYYTETGNVKVGNVYIHPLILHRYGSTPTVYALEILDKDAKYLYTSSGIMKTHLAEGISAIMNNYDVLIFGSHGTQYNDYYFDKYFEHPNKIVISSAEMYILPTLLEEYHNSECKIIFCSDPISIKK